MVSRPSITCSAPKYITIAVPLAINTLTPPA